MKIFPIPSGTRDLLPREAEQFRYLESRIRHAFRSFGYSEVITPTLESEQSLEAAGEKRLSRTYRMLDDNGDMLVLRPEMTIPIARLVAGRAADRELPMRLSYFANSFRPTEPQRGRQTEFFQAGLELIGESSPATDAETIAVLCRALDACGLEDYLVSLGEVTFFRALLDDAGVDPAGQRAILEALEQRDLVALAGVLSGMGLAGDDPEAIREVATLRGGSEVLSRAQDLATSELMRQALRRLARVYYLLTRYDLADRVMFDMGIFRDFDYYTGIVFEVLSEGTGFPIGGGGRYDGLLARFGLEAPAVGFAIGMERLQLAVSRGEDDMDSDRGPSAVLIGGMDSEMDLAAYLREKGIEIYSVSSGEQPERARLLALENHIPFIIKGGKEGYQLLGVAGGESLRLDIDSLLKAMGC